MDLEQRLRKAKFEMDQIHKRLVDVTEEYEGSKSRFMKLKAQFEKEDMEAALKDKRFRKVKPEEKPSDVLTFVNGLSEAGKEALLQKLKGVL